MNKKGFITVNVVLWSVVLIPVFLFVAIEFPYFVYERSRLKGITDNMASSAVTILEEELIAEGILKIDENGAKDMADTVLKRSLLLNDDYTPTQRSNLSERPTIDVRIYNDIPEGGIVEYGVFLQNPTVIIKAEYEIKGLIFRGLTVPMKILSSAQAQFN